VRGIAPKHSTLKVLDPKLMEELNSLDPFAPGKTKEEKEDIWARINEIRDMIGDNNDEKSSESHGFEEVSSDHSDQEIEGSQDNDTEEKIQVEQQLSPSITNNSNSPLRLDVASIKRAASKNIKKAGEKTKIVAEKTREKGEVLSSRTAVSARSIKSSVGNVTKSVVSRVKKD